MLKQPAGMSSGSSPLSELSTEEEIVRGRVIGIGVDVLKMGAAVRWVCHQARSGVGGYVCAANAHMLVTARRNPRFNRVLLNASLIIPDGMPLVWLLRREGKDVERVCGPDLMLKVCSAAEKLGLSIYLYGADAGCLNGIQAKLMSLFPGLCIAGCEAPPILPAEPGFDAAVIERISNSGAQIVFVGLGCPKQEYWMAAHAESSRAVLIGVGAAFDFVAGRKARAPLWLGRAGLEWAFRLATEPRRLWRRYLVTNSQFGLYVLRDLIYGVKIKKLS